jgi:hypothetical protein
MKKRPELGYVGLRDVGVGGLDGGQLRHQRLQREIAAAVVDADASHVLEAAGLRDLRLGREAFGRRRLLAGLDFDALGHRQADVFGARGERLDLRQQLVGGVDAVEAQPHHPPVVGREVHGVERRRHLLVRRQVVDRVLPQGEARAALRQQDLDAPLAPRPRLAQVQDHHRDARVHQLPLGRRRTGSVKRKSHH